jgi:hypothetical protein
MSAASLMTAVPSSSARLLADVVGVHGRDAKDREPVVDRLAAALGPEFAERLVAALSKDALDRLDAGLSRDFADRLAALAREAA